jgi:hypothetical protein
VSDNTFIEVFPIREPHPCHYCGEPATTSIVGSTSRETGYQDEIFVCDEHYEMLEANEP